MNRSNASIGQISLGCHTTWRNSERTGPHLSSRLRMRIMRIFKPQKISLQTPSHSETTGTGYHMPTNNDEHPRYQFSVITALATPTQSSAASKMSEYESPENTSNLQGASQQTSMIRTYFRARRLRIYRTAAANNFSS